MASRKKDFDPRDLVLKGGRGLDRLTPGAYVGEGVRSLLARFRRPHDSNHGPPQAPPRARSVSVPKLRGSSRSAPSLSRSSRSGSRPVDEGRRASDSRVGFEPRGVSFVPAPKRVSFSHPRPRSTSASRRPSDARSVASSRHGVESDPETPTQRRRSFNPPPKEPPRHTSLTKVRAALAAVRERIAASLAATARLEAEHAALEDWLRVHAHHANAAALNKTMGKEQALAKQLAAEVEARITLRRKELKLQDELKRVRRAKKAKLAKVGGVVADNDDLKSYVSAPAAMPCSDTPPPRRRLSLAVAGRRRSASASAVRRKSLFPSFGIGQKPVEEVLSVYDDGPKRYVL